MNLLQNLCELLSDQKNLYAIRALYRVIQLSETQVQQFAETIGQVLDKFIMDVAKEETDLSQNYIYILFETTALTIKFMKGNNEIMMGF
jgi:hypothetical protein